MTTPIASLFTTPLEAGAQTAAASAGAGAGSVAVFETLISAFFQAAENTAPLPDSVPQVQSQTPETGAPVSVETVKADLTLAQAASTDPTQIFAPGPANPQPPNPAQDPDFEGDFRAVSPAQQGTHALDHNAPPAAAQHGLQIAELHTDLPFDVETGVQNQPALPQEAPNAADPDAPSLRIDAPEASANDAPVADNAHAKPTAGEAFKATPSKDSPLTAKEDEAPRRDETADLPVLDILSLSEIAPRVVAQFLAAQTQPDVPALPAENNDSAANNAAANAPSPTGQTDTASADTPLPIQTATPPELTPAPAIDAGETEIAASRPPIGNNSAEAPREELSDAATQIAMAPPPQIDTSDDSEEQSPRGNGLPESARENPPKTTEPGKRAERAPPFGGDKNSVFHASGKAASAPGQIKAPFEPAQPVFPHIAQNNAPASGASDGAPSPAPASAPANTASDPIHFLGNEDAAETIGQPAVPPSVSDAETLASSAPNQIAAKPQFAHEKLADASGADAAIDESGANSASVTPALHASNTALVAAATGNTVVTAHSAAPTVPDAADAARVSVQTIERGAPELSGVQRPPRGSLRETSEGKRNSADEPALPATSESKNSSEKAASVAPADLAQNFEPSNPVAKITAPHSPEPAGTSIPDQTANAAPDAEVPPVQAVKADALDAPNQPQLPPPATEIVTPIVGAAHGLAMSSTHAATPAQDVPVRVVSSAPGAPDKTDFDALALKITSHSSDGDNRFSIRLDPPELGKIEVNLSVDADGHARAELSADKPQTLDMLQKDASSLERALRDAGLNLSGGLAFSLKGDGRSQTWRDAQGGRSRSLQIAAADAVSANTALTARAALAAHAYGLPTSHLDIRV